MVKKKKEKKKEKIPTQYKVTGLISFKDNDEVYPKEIKDLMKKMIDLGCMNVGVNFIK